jgi:hypothetical protein
MGLSLAYLDALLQYLEDQYESAPPTYGSIGTFKIGSFQEDPETAPAIVTLHTSNPDSETDAHWEMVVEQGRLDTGTGGGRHRLWGAYHEMGGGSFIWFYWWIRMQYFMTRQGMTQEDARQRADDVMRWLSKKASSATPTELSLATQDGESLLQTEVMRATLREAGGKPRQYIWQGVLKVQGLVYRE